MNAIKDPRKMGLRPVVRSLSLNFVFHFPWRMFVPSGHELAIWRD